MGAEGQYLKVLNRPDLPAEVLQELLADRTARKYHTVRRALAGHPKTPRRDALSLVSTLYWRDLAFLSADARVHPEVRRAADRDLARRLPEMALAERVDVAKSAGRGMLQLLRFDPDSRVFQAVLDNRLATESDLIQVAARLETPPASLESLAAHPRWGARPGLRSALLRNPRLPVPVALSLLSRATAADLDGIRESTRISPLVKACAERVLAERRKAL